MNYPLSKGSKTTVVSLSIIALFSLLTVNVASESTTNVDQVVSPLDYQEFQIVLGAGETVKIDLDVKSGPNLGFYFVDQTGFDELEAAWPGAGLYTYSAALSAEDAPSIHKSAPAPAEGIFYLVITNKNSTQAATVAGTIKSATHFPDALFTVLIIAIAAIFVIATIAAVLITRSLRAKVQQYSPPGQPTPQAQTHLHKTTPKPVVQQTIKRTCPKCGAAVAGGSVVCRNCGNRL